MAIPVKQRIAGHRRIESELLKILPVVENAKASGEVTPDFLQALIVAFKQGVHAPRVMIPNEGSKTSGTPWAPVIAFLKKAYQNGWTRKYFASRAKSEIGEVLNQAFDSCLYVIENAIATNRRKAEEMENAQAEKERSAQQALAKQAEAARRKRELAEQREQALANEHPELAADIDALLSGELVQERDVGRRRDSDGHFHYTPETYTGLLESRLEEKMAEEPALSEDIDAMTEEVKGLVRWLVNSLAYKPAGEYSDEEIENLLGELVSAMSTQLIRLGGLTAKDALDSAQSWMSFVRKSAFDRAKMQHRVDPPKPPTAQVQAKEEQGEEGPETVDAVAPTLPAPATDNASVQELFEKSLGLEKSKPEEALKLVAQARKLDPNHRELMKLERRIKHALRMANQKVTSTSLAIGEMKPVAKPDKDSKKKSGGKPRKKSTQADAAS